MVTRSRSQRVPNWRVVRKLALFGAAFGPIGALMGKLAEKPGENRRKSRGKWRKMAVFPRV
jgi:hypothetical protein